MAKKSRRKIDFPSPGLAWLAFEQPGPEVLHIGNNNIIINGDQHSTFSSLAVDSYHISCILVKPFFHVVTKIEQLTEGDAKRQDKRLLTEFSPSPVTSVQVFHFISHYFYYIFTYCPVRQFRLSVNIYTL